MNGILIIYVWAYENKDNDYEEKLLDKSLVSNKSFIPHEEQNLNNIKSYFHLFKKDELEFLLKTFKNIEIVSSYSDGSNWCTVVKKINID